MTQLTEERFEQLLDKRLGATEARIIKRIDDAQEELARMVANTVAEPFTKRFDELEKTLDVIEQLKSFERKFQKIEEALHIRL